MVSPSTCTDASGVHEGLDEAVVHSRWLADGVVLRGARLATSGDARLVLAAVRRVRPFAVAALAEQLSVVSQLAVLVDRTAAAVVRGTCLRGWAGRTVCSPHPARVAVARADGRSLDGCLQHAAEEWAALPAVQQSLVGDVAVFRAVEVYGRALDRVGALGAIAGSMVSGVTAPVRRAVALAATELPAVRRWVAERYR
jgi:hypothetical protein